MQASKSGKKTNSRKKGSRKGKAIQPQLPQSGVINRPLPSNFRVSLTFQDLNIFGSSTKVVRGISEFLAKPPMFYNYFYGIYKYARVVATDVEVHWLSTGPDPMRVAIGRVPYSDTAGITYNQFSEMPETQCGILSVSGGMDRLVQKQHFRARAANGQPLTDHSYWINSTQAISATPLHNDDYVTLVMTQGATVNSAAQAIVRVKYHIEWFELQYAV